MNQDTRRIEKLEERIARLERLCSADIRTAARLTPRLRALERERESLRASAPSETESPGCADEHENPTLCDELAARRLTAYLEQTSGT